PHGAGVQGARCVAVAADPEPPALAGEVVGFGCGGGAFHGPHAVSSVRPHEGEGWGEGSERPSAAPGDSGSTGGCSALRRALRPLLGPTAVHADRTSPASGHRCP